jgi:Transposase DDE domain
MRHYQSSNSRRAARVVCRSILRRHLGFGPHGRRWTAVGLVDLVLLVSACGSTLFDVVRRFFAGSHEAARQALYANLPALGVLRERLLDGLYAPVPRRVLRRGLDVALDRHDVPFYGAAATRGVVAGPKKRGTHRCFAYVTAVAVTPPQRYTLALAPLHDTRFWPAVGGLLAQLRARGVRIRCLLLDRGFFSAEVVRELRRRGVPFAVGVPRKGDRWQAVFDRPTGEPFRFAWTGDDGRRSWVDCLTWRRWVDPKGRPAKRPRPAPYPVPVSARTRRKPAQRRRIEVVAVAYGRLRGLDAANRFARALALKRRYGRRFGIETSYRQMNQAKGWTCSTDERYRLLLLGVALLLRQVWVALRAADPADRTTLREVLDGIADDLRHRHPPRRSPTPTPIPWFDRTKP